MSTPAPALPPLLLWCDLETTGLNEREGGVLEAAFTLTDASLVELVDPIEFMVLPDGAVLAGKTLICRDDRGRTQWTFNFDDPDDVAAVMHRQSGLAGEWVDRFADRTLTPASLVAERVAAWLDLYELDWRNALRPLALAGGGTDRFDRLWLPQLGVDKLVAYWGIDTSPLRRFLTHVLRCTPDRVPADRPHRAAADMAAALAEARMIRDLLAAGLSTPAGR